MKVKKEKPTRKDIIKCSLAIILYIAFLIWIESWWGIIVLPFIFDNYITHFINWSWWKESDSPMTRTLMSWVDAIVFALVAVYFVNIYFFQNYTIPSSSLEKSLLVGDYLMVSKSSYGARVPQTPLHMPLCQHTLPLNLGKSYLEWIKWDYKRIHPSRIPLNDIVVFNYPAGDTILTGEHYQTEYYRMRNDRGEAIYQQLYGVVRPDSLSPLERYRYYQTCQQLGSDYLKKHAYTLNNQSFAFGDEEEFGEIGWRPVDRRENYVKRCVGTPGQTLQIKDRIIYLDGKANKEPDKVQYNYMFHLKQHVPEDLCEALQISNEALLQYNSYGCMPLTNEGYITFKNRTDLVDSISVVPEEGNGLYPWNYFHGWTRDNYGPLWIPEKGKQIPGGLNIDNLPIYERCIAVYEGNDLKVTNDGKILINGKEATNYTFKMDYYWMMGDNRHNSADSRYWGFVPEDHVVGKPVLIWFSTDPDKGFFQGIRWERLFRWVDNIK
ncbi:MAG: S26 family signal peptidase [Bacteroidales bacterium]|nr:S26 family signal peptidase [Bacteroidales bacterium]